MKAGKTPNDRYVELVARMIADDRDGAKAYMTAAGTPLTDQDVSDVRAAAGLADALFELGASLWNVPEAKLEAIHVFRLAADNGSIDATKALGDSLNWMGHHEEAIPALREAILLDEDDLRAVGLLGISLYELHRHAEAEPYLRRALGADPSLALPLADIVLEKGETGEYFKLIHSAAAADVYGADILLGNIYSERCDEISAIRSYRKGIASGDAHSAFNLGVLYHEREDFEQARVFFGEARRLGDLRASPFDGYDDQTTST